MLRQCCPPVMTCACSPGNDAALKAAQRAAGEQRLPGETEGISYEDKQAVWHQELSAGDDRPTTRVQDAD